MDVNGNWEMMSSEYIVLSVCNAIDCRVICYLRVITFKPDRFPVARALSAGSGASSRRQTMLGAGSPEALHLKLAKSPTSTIASLLKIEAVGRTIRFSNNTLIHYYTSVNSIKTNPCSKQPALIII